MKGREIYAAAIAAAPFLLLTLLNSTRLFGPGPRGAHRKHRRGELTLDLIVLAGLTSAFFTSLVALAVDGAPDLRVLVAYGLAFGGFGVFVHGFVDIRERYRRDELASDATSEEPAGATTS